MPRGRKTCPKCDKLQSNTTATCDCGHIFFRVGAINRIHIYSYYRQYTVQCPQCHGYVYKFYGECGCGYKFK
jgi:hypothetical protein